MCATYMSCWKAVRLSVWLMLALNILYRPGGLRFVAILMPWPLGAGMAGWMSCLACARLPLKRVDIAQDEEH